MTGPENGEGEATAKCPYCGCGFVPQEPGQVYCSPVCEQQEALERGEPQQPDQARS